MATYSKITKSFDIINNNDLPIRIYVVPVKQRFTFPDGEGVSIFPHSTKTVNFAYFSEYAGFHNLIVRVVINETHIFEMTMMAHVVTRKLNISPSYTIFAPTDPPFKFIYFHNPLNVSIDYAWDVMESNFIIEPLIGKVPPMKDMACMITYDPLRNESNNIDLRYSNHAHHKFLYNVKAEPNVINTVLCENEIRFGYVGCNMLQFKHAFLWNFSNCAVAFQIVHPKLITGLSVIPAVGAIQKNSYQLLTVELRSVECISFKYVFDININSKATHELKVSGHILFPNIKFSPSALKLKKMPVTSFQKNSVTLTNKTKASTHFYFNFQNLFHYPISETADGERFEEGGFYLDPGQSKLLYIQVDPTNVTCMWYMMPLVINYILGPPTSPSVLAAKTKTYIRNTENKLPENFPILKIFSTVIESDFSISKLDFHFVYYPYNPDKSICSGSTVFENVSSEKTLQFCIRLDKMFDPFEIDFQSLTPVIPHPFSVTFILEPGDSTTLRIRYKPTFGGAHQHNCSIPFYVQNDYADDEHNYLRLRGTYKVPEIFAPKTIYFEFLPLRFKFNKSIRVLATDHSDDCKIRANSENQNLQTVISYLRYDHKVHEIDVTIIYTSQYVEAFKSSINFHCNCGGRFETVCYGVAENSIFTSFRVVKNVQQRIYLEETQSKASLQHSEAVSYLLANDHISFPHFPEATDTDFKFLNEVIDVLESWLYCQGFIGLFRYKIPDSFSTVVPLPKTKEVVGMKSTTSTIIYVSPYVELLRKVASIEIANKFNVEIKTTSQKDKTKQLYCLYKNILAFLKDLNGYFPHIEPELLLTYHDYKIYTNTIVIDSTKLSQKQRPHNYYNFNLLCKQAWMDVILQTLKIFIFGRITIPKDPKVLRLLEIQSCDSRHDEDPHQANSVSVKHSVSERSIEFHKLLDNSCDGFCDNTVTPHHIYSNSEYFLLNWISYCYCNTIDSLCPRAKTGKIVEKYVDDFDSCFMDSLLIVTAIATYCPYLKKYFTNLYWPPIGSEQFHHNAARVIQVLSLIKCSFELRPCNIYNPVNIQMALFVAYLYEFLPTMYPHTTITVGANLSKTTSIKISITNDSNNDIYYVVSFFENDHNCFFETRSSLTIKARTRETLTIKYAAKYCRKVKAILVLCGETLGKHYAKSIVYNLVGEPDVTYIFRSYSFYTKLYTTKEQVWNITSPYKVAACYDLYFSLEALTTYETLLLVDFNDIVNYRLPCCFQFYTSQILFNEQGEASITITGIALTMRNRKVWWMFRNAEVGDFLIVVEMFTAPTKEVEILTAQIPVEIYNRKCLCPKSRTFCKKFMLIKIPKTNLTMMEALRKIFVKLKGGQEEFWSAYLRKNSSIRHMKKFLAGGYNHDMLLYLDLLVSDKTYKATLIPSRPDLIVSPTFEITNMELDFAKDAYEIMHIHVGNIPVSSFLLELWNDVHQELRRYKVVVATVF